MELDEGLEEAQHALGLAVQQEWAWKGAERAFRRALELNPGSARAELSYALLLRTLGRPEEARVRFERAVEFDPLSVDAKAGLAALYLLGLAGERERATEQLRETLLLDPDSIGTHLILARAHFVSGRNADAIAAARTAAELGQRSPSLVGFLAATLARVGEREEARTLLEELLQRPRERYVDAYVIAMVYWALGEEQQALDWLERAYEERSQLLASSVSRPEWDGLRDDPRFADLVRRMGLPAG